MVDFGLVYVVPLPPTPSTRYSWGASCRSGESDRLSPMWPNRAFPCPQNKFQFDMERSQTLKRVFECFADFVYLRNVVTLEEGCTEIGFTFL